MNTKRNRSAPADTHLLAFVLLTFAISWSAWIPLALASRGVIGLAISPGLLKLVGTFGPSLAAVIVTGLSGHRAAVQRLLARLLIWRVSIVWYGFVLLWPAVLSLTTTAIHLALGAPAPDWDNPPLRSLYPLPPELAQIGLWALLPFVFVQQLVLSSPLGEEIGWRGYALPALHTRTSSLIASVVLGLIWSVWHLPLYFTSGDPAAGTFFGWLPLGLIPTTMLFSWVFSHTRGSLLLALLFHTAINVTGLFLAATATIPLVSPALTWIVALIVLGSDARRPVAGHQRAS